MSKAITIGLAAYDSMKTKTALSLATAVAATAGAGVDINFAARSGPYVHWSREALVEDAVNAGTSHLMMIDTDVVFPPDAILRLLALEKDIVGGLYMMKTLPAVHTIKFSREDDSDEATVRVLPTEPFRCAAVPTGFMLIDIAALDRVPRPLFECVRPVGEDVSFCVKATNAGLEVWCDPTFKIDHLGDYAY